MTNRPNNKEKRTFDRNNILSKIQRLEKIVHKPNTLYDIWLPNRIPKDTNSEIGNQCMAQGQGHNIRKSFGGQALIKMSKNI